MRLLYWNLHKIFDPTKVLSAYGLWVNCYRCGIYVYEKIDSAEAQRIGEMLFDQPAFVGAKVLERRRTRGANKVASAHDSRTLKLFDMQTHINFNDDDEGEQHENVYYK